MTELELETGLVVEKLSGDVEIVVGDDESDFSDDCQMDFDGIKDLWVRKQRKPPWVEVASRHTSYLSITLTYFDS